MWLQVQIPKDMRLKKIGVHAQNMITILVSIVNIIEEDLYDHLMSTRISLLIMNKRFV